jgi:hypothetical protein
MTDADRSDRSGYGRGASGLTDRDPGDQPGNGRGGGGYKAKP